ncbi:MAG TPA: FHA domain-containing protein [Bryobacteraceae bacterium]|nr:FHA domain-containing protein [Bryobacteraceae bacterium]
MNPSLAPEPRPDAARRWTARLPRYSRDEASLANWLARAMPGGEWWKARIGEALGAFLERPAGTEITVRQKNSVDASEHERALAFQKQEILIGRDEDNDITIPVRAAGKRHARIRIDRGSCFVEDLGSALGTYVNKVRLPANTPRLLATGDQLAIFPYTFDVALNQTWERDSEVLAAAGGTHPATWAEFSRTAAWDRAPLPVTILPFNEVACIEAGGPFLDELFNRITQPLGVARSALGVSAFDSGIAELLVATLAETANCTLKFPVQIEPGPLNRAPQASAATRGLVVCFSLRMAGVTGAFRLWLPFRLIAALAEEAGGSEDAAPVSWSFPVSRGWVELSAMEAASLERNDVVLIEPEAALLLPGDPDRGWRLSFMADNINKVSLDNYFEREPLTNGETKTQETPAVLGKPDLGQFEVRLHVILGEKVLTLAEANGLASGSVLDLDLPAGPVRLAVNGRVVGEGELVDVEGRLGVRIAGWRGA